MCYTPYTEKLKDASIDFFIAQFQFQVEHKQHQLKT